MVFSACEEITSAHMHLRAMSETDPMLEQLIQRADEHHLIDDCKRSDELITLRVGARDLEMTPAHALRFLQGLLAGFEHAMQQMRRRGRNYDP